MNMIDFEYDGIRLSSLKMSISSFSDPDDEQEPVSYKHLRAH